MLTVWGRKSSSNVQALMWCIGELGLAYERIDAGFKYGVNDTVEFLAMNPNGTVPVLREDDGEPLWETGAIIRYLAAQHGDEAFWPDDARRRAQIDKWAEWAKLNITLNFTGPVFWRVVRTAPALQDQQAIAAALTALGAKLDIAERQLERHRFLAGDDLTLADIQFGHVLYRYFDIDIPRPSLPRLERYYENLTERPAFREHVMVSYEELRVL
ncbi:MULTISPECIES: glutathione S-transferase family protein [Rhizobium]|jgi:glutathione S-transferase|uniref:Glutathione S-transferase n=1 Tax=Rhizobium lusitanum TaxID=293958 RepID=A0A1C3U2C5_9HYPH|nr:MULTISPECIES: glutathione S-transferase family protein [Rhizobium]NKJ06979.1 glutathione S-transferase [Rhizobium sp. SG741]NRP84815.1 Glutathione S-transferase GstB [Ensifer adhaerens]NTJ06309.1 glutathione S-transferase family protein [Rhizobium lusitanum]SCB09552.1 Glutathione S-transferase [Rhizobium lusitanum]